MEEAKEEKHMICDIFIKTYDGDFTFLNYCLRSIGKFVSGVRAVVLVLPTQSIEQFARVSGESSEPVMATLNTFLQIKGIEEYGADGYLSQQVFKLHADTFSDAEFILHVDSDTIFTTPVTPETYFTNAKIDWMMTPYSMIETPWQPITEKFLAMPAPFSVSFEFMRRAPQMIPRWLYPALREFCVQKHGCTLDQYIMKQPYRAFSEYNALGAFAYYCHHDQFKWINTAEVPESEWPPLTVLQKYSHGGLTTEIVDEFEAILSQ